MKKKSKGKLITNDNIIDTGKVEHYTPEEAKAAKKLRVAQDLHKEMTEEEQIAIEEARERYGKLEEQMIPFADKINAEQDEMIQRAMYSIIGDRLDIGKNAISKIFEWVTVHKHPRTGIIDVTKNYKVMVFHGDSNYEVFRGKCSACKVTMTLAEFGAHESTHVKESKYLIDEQAKARTEPKMLIWWRYEAPLVIHKKDSDKIISVKNNWELLFNPEEHIYPMKEGGE